LWLRYQILYKVGKKNVVVDALSRRVDRELRAITTMFPTLQESIMETYKDDPFIQNIIAKKMVNSGGWPNYSFSEELLKLKNRVVIGFEGNIKKRLVMEANNSYIGACLHPKFIQKTEGCVLLA